MVSVLAIASIAVIFLTIWTALDAPMKQPLYTMPDDIADDGSSTIVLQTFFCSSESSVWQFISVGWMGLLLLVTSVLAFQTRNVRADFNESQTLGLMTYSHLVFVCIRLATLFVEEDVGPSQVAQFRSILYSADTLSTLTMYFFPKFVALRQSDELAEDPSSWLPRDNKRASTKANHGSGPQYPTPVATGNKSQPEREHPAPPEGPSQAAPPVGLNSRSSGETHSSSGDMMHPQIQTPTASTDFVKERTLDP